VRNLLQLTFLLRVSSGNEIEPAGPVDGRPEECEKRLAFLSFLTGVERRSGRFILAAAVRPEADSNLEGLENPSPSAHATGHDSARQDRLRVCTRR
jgi:hypothetical protein